MKRTSYLTCIKYLFLRKSTDVFKEILIKNFIPGYYSHLPNEAVEIKRISETSDLYEVTQITGDQRQSWTGFYESSSRQLVDLQRSSFLAFIPEHKKLLFASKIFIKQY